MRRIEKLPPPQVLVDNAQQWTNDFVANPDNDTARYRYRNKDIKDTLVRETANKCIYCESKIGHNTPGDVEHKIPTSHDKTQHFVWANLTIACTECNRRKLHYYAADAPFIDPYTDDVETRVLHFGPVVSWLPADVAAETSIRKLELHSQARRELLFRKVEAIDHLNNLVARIKKEEGLLKDALIVELEQMKSRSYEYSAMLLTICAQYGL
jgi:hypothetical protein